eukprot:scaffold222635_cov31-Tisochrysis_lutea.AAC.2
MYRRISIALLGPMLAMANLEPATCSFIRCRKLQDGSSCPVAKTASLTASRRLIYTVGEHRVQRSHQQLPPLDVSPPLQCLAESRPPHPALPIAAEGKVSDRP